jgi:ribosomal protein S18 acetylase RimI-like enzyme
VSEAICAILCRSYAVEAELIGVEDFPPLRRTSEDIRASQSTFIGCSSENRLVAVAELEHENDRSTNIAGFVVHPEFFRRGIGSHLLRHVLASVGTQTVTVSTAAANVPAVSLYEIHGFSIFKRWSIEDLEMVTLARSLSGTMC